MDNIRQQQVDGLGAQNPGQRMRRTPEESERKHDPERTKQDILKIATEEFATRGLSGARVGAIAERTRTTKAMIYYYFGSKEGLYLAVLEQAYRDIRDAEKKLRLERLRADDAIRRMVEFVFDYEEANPGFVRLVSIENINHGKYLAQSKSIQSLNVTVIEALADILKRGQRDGVFRADVDPFDLHLLMTSFCFFRVSNRYTFGEIFPHDLSDPAIRARHRKMITEAVLAYLQSKPTRLPR